MESRNFVKCEYPWLIPSEQNYLPSYDKVDPLLKREQFAVTLRKQKRTEIIAVKRRKIMEQQPDQESGNFESKFCVYYDGYPEFKKQP